MLASDASHYYANMEEGRVFPIVYHVGDVLEGYRRLSEIGAIIRAYHPGP